MLTAIYNPNRKVVAVTAPASWSFIDKSGNLQTSFGNGNVPWPNLDPGLFAQSMIIRTENSNSGSPIDGAQVYIAWNIGVAPLADNLAHFLSGSGQTLTVPGPIYAVWVKAVPGTTAPTVVFEVVY